MAGFAAVCRAAAVVEAARALADRAAAVAADSPHSPLGAADPQHALRAAGPRGGPAMQSGRAQEPPFHRRRRLLTTAGAVELQQFAP